MLRNIGVGLLMVAFVLALIWASGARAEATQVGDTLALEGQIVCDTENQVQQIADIDQKTKGQGVFELVEMFRQIPDAAGEPTCSIQRVEGVVMERKEVGRVWMPDGEEADGFLVRLKGESEEFWIIQAVLITPSI